ncbi:MAG: NAD-dependent epimerase/dehydratase family protein [Egibacteraceae bacterium]
MNQTRKPVLVTGHQGFIGSVMAPYLLRQGWDVVGLDTGYFAECTLVPDPVEIPTIRKDLRDLEPDDLRSFYAVVHLAALSNDPIGNLDATWTEQINHEASVRLAELARDADCRRFLFSSSCIMYGMSNAAEVDETSPLDPQTVYARSKVRSEEAIREMATDSFSPSFLRNGTVYGVSPRMRFDTVLNNLVGQAVTTGKVTLFSDGAPWRPVLHVEDVSRAFEAVLEAPAADVHNEAFNTGANHLNHQVRELAEIVVETIPGCELEIRAEPDADQRTYKADFTKFAKTFGDFEFRWNARSGARQVAETLNELGLGAEDFSGRKYVRLRWLNHLRESGRLDGALRWTEGE